MPTIAELKEKSGRSKFASILGKSTINSETEEYQFIVKAVEYLMKNGYGVLHGGYAGGAMSAASDTANRMIAELGLPPEANIGVPQIEHDLFWPRVEGASFVDPAKDIYNRLDKILSSDVAVVAPLGGDGTELEEAVVFHENVIRQRVVENPAKYPDFMHVKVVPLIFLMTKNGTNWRIILETKMKHLAAFKHHPSEYSWIHFVESIEDFEKLIASLNIAK